LQQGEFSVLEFLSVDIGRNWIYMKKMSGTKWMRKISIEYWWRRIESIIVYWGLNKDHDEVRGMILGIKPLAKDKEIF